MNQSQKVVPGRQKRNIMCGRYALSMPYVRVRAVLEENGMHIDEDDADQPEQADGQGQDHDQDQDQQEHDALPLDGHFHPTYNFAPGYLGIVCRAVDQPADKAQLADKAKPADFTALHYRLQTMKWGLVPSWAGSTHPTRKMINCRADSLHRGGLWASMRSRQRCVVVAEGFYEWMRAGPKGQERLPYYIHRADGRPLLLAGLWARGRRGSATAGPRPCTYTIITTDASAPMRFLHDRMPVILDLDAAALRTWLDPGRTTWSEELHALLRPWPYDEGPRALVFDAVSTAVNRVGHSAPEYIVPVERGERGQGIAGYFVQGEKEKEKKEKEGASKPSPKGEKREGEETPAKRKAGHLVSPSKKRAAKPSGAKITSYFERK